MRIQKLELCGFKSFKDRTVIQFDPGTTGIVGPNGCGKSNIVDALVWVMGEMSAKHLRGSSMTDVIFAGAEGYAAAGMAEVSLTLENDGGAFPAKYAKYSEVMVTRKLHRSGESEYLVNKEPARLRDIQEIFMDTGAGSKGFSIVEQGAIGKIITSKPEERRSLIEEAAGITKFKARKKESQRKLVSTDQNLVRLKDIIGEQKRQIASLERQAARAERFRKIKNELEERELKLNSKKFLELDVQYKEVSSAFDDLQLNEVGASTNIDELNAKIQELKFSVTEKEALVTEKQELQKSSGDLVRETEINIREQKFEIEQARRDDETTVSILEQYQSRRNLLAEDKASLTAKLEQGDIEVSELDTNYQEKYEVYSTHQARITEIDEDLTKHRRELITKGQAASHLEAQTSALTEQITRTEAQKSEQQVVLEELETKHADYEKNNKEVTSSLEKERQLQLSFMSDVSNFEENLFELEQQKEVKLKEAEAFSSELNEVSGRLYGLKDLHANFEGFQEGVKKVIFWHRKKQETMQMEMGGGPVAPEIQPVSEVVEVEEKYELAMEAALGTKLQMLLTKDQDQTIDAINYLKENKSGRSSFFASSKDNVTASQSQDMSSNAGFVSYLSDVVSAPDKYKEQVNGFLSDTVVVDSLMSAIELKKQYQDYSYVTLEGDTLSKDGIVTGGTSESADTGVLKRKREIKDLSQRKEEWAGKLSLAKLSLDKVNASIKTLENDLENAKRKNNEQEILVAEFKKDLERAENEIANSNRAMENQNRELSKLNEQIERVNEKLTTALETLNDLRSETSGLESSINEFDIELADKKSNIESLQNEVTELKVKLASKTQEIESGRLQLGVVTKSLDEVTSQLNEMSEKSDFNKTSMSEGSLKVDRMQLDLDKQIVDAQNSEAELAKSQNDYEMSYESSRVAESELLKEQTELNEYKAKVNETQLQVEQLKMKLTYLEEQTLEKYHVQISEKSKEFADIDINVAEEDVLVEELKSKMAKMGEVNLSAIEEFEEISERYKFLTAQHEDLIEAKDQLRKVIDRINRICSRRFNETFELVNDRFEQVFPVLFGGGEAKLILIEHEVAEDGTKKDPGIDIMARPPGKKLQGVTLLSGGEKALTAVSLIFSIFLVKPSPFCLLDEVDAPLDDANVMRFNDLVTEMAKRSQIIVVTHNKHTMKVNNKLYGVTMQEKGVSKMVSVDIES